MANLNEDWASMSPNEREVYKMQNPEEFYDEDEEDFDEDEDEEEDDTCEELGC